MNIEILKNIAAFSEANITDERLEILQALVDFIQKKVDANETIRLNFICTHNSRRSHLSQVWAQAMAHHFGLKNVYCYSGGTEATAMYPQVADTLVKQGFLISKLSDGTNPVYAVKYAANEMPIICFSKRYDSNFNPQGNFAAIMTCNNADQNCPMVYGAETRIPVKYNDPKAYDGLPEMAQKYTERSLEIGQEMWYVFGKIRG